MPRENLSLVFPKMSDTRWTVQPQKMAKGLAFRILEVKYRKYSENEGADQLHNCCAADIRHCFRMCKKTGILMTRPIK